MTSIADHVVFNDQKLAKRFANKRIPMAVLYEAYFAGDIDIPGDIYAFLEARSGFVKYSLTPEHFRWAVTNFVPEALIHSKLRTSASSASTTTAATTSSAGSSASAWSTPAHFSRSPASRWSRRRTTS